MLQKMFPKKDEKVPEIRFREFDKKWERKILEDCIKSVPTKKYLAHEDVLNKGKHEVIQQGQKPTLGYSNEENFYKNYKEVVLFGDHTLSLYKPRRSFLLSTDGIKILKSTTLDSSFMYVLLQKYLPESQGYKRHFSIFKETLVRYPTSIKEQQKIGSFFKTLDEKIEQEEEKLEAYKDMKKALMQRMFV